MCKRMLRPLERTHGGKARERRLVRISLKTAFVVKVGRQGYRDRRGHPFFHFNEPHEESLARVPRSWDTGAWRKLRGLHRGRGKGGERRAVYGRMDPPHRGGFLGQMWVRRADLQPFQYLRHRTF